METHQPTGPPEGPCTPPLTATDVPGHVVPVDPLWLPAQLQTRRPLSPPTHLPPPPPPTPPPRLLLCHDDPIGCPEQPEGDAAAETGMLKRASAAGRLQDVHQILAQYILTQSPDPTTGRLWLNLFHESITEAITNHHPAILSYLFFMRVGDPALHVKSALRARSRATFSVFLDYGWNINAPVERTMSPVLGYVSDDRALTEWFLDHGADPNARCAWDFTPLSEAMYRAPLDTIKMLFRRGGDISRGQLLHNAVLRDHPDAIELVALLIERGAPVNEIQYENHPQAFRERSAFALGTPLHYAAEGGKTELVSYLIQRGADPSIQDTKGRTVMETAEHFDQPGVMWLLRNNPSK